LEARHKLKGGISFPCEVGMIISKPNLNEPTSGLSYDVNAMFEIVGGRLLPFAENKNEDRNIGYFAGIGFGFQQTTVFRYNLIMNPSTSKDVIYVQPSEKMYNKFSEISFGPLLHF
jgi:hypothetical protein